MRRSDERGAATLLAVALGAVLAAVVVVVAVASDLLAARQRAAAAADLGALAGVPGLTRTPDEACLAAGFVVRRNGAVLRECRVVGDDVWVVVSAAPRTRWTSWLLALGGEVPEPTVRAHAGRRPDPAAASG